MRDDTKVGFRVGQILILRGVVMEMEDTTTGG